MNLLYKMWFRSWPVVRKLVYYGVCLYGMVWANIFAASLMIYGNIFSLAFGLFLLIVIWLAFMFLALREVMYYAGKVD